MAFDPSSALARYAPGKGVTTRIDFGVETSAWTELNDADFPRYFIISLTEAAYVVIGPAFDEAEDIDFILPAGIHDFIVQPHYGISVLAVSTAGTLTAACSGV